MLPAYSWPWSKDKNKKGEPLSEGGVSSGYVGTLPDVEAEFDYMRPDVKSKNVFKVDENAKIEEKTTSPLKNAVKGAGIAAGSYLGFETIRKAFSKYKLSRDVVDIKQYIIKATDKNISVRACLFC